MLHKVIREFRDSEQETAVVETGLILSLSLLLLVGGLELGHGLSYHHAAEKALRNTTGYLARIPRTTPLDADFAKQLLQESNALAINVSDLNSVTVDVDAGRFTDEYVNLTAVVTYKVWLLSAVFPNPSFTFSVQHEQPRIPE